MATSESLWLYGGIVRYAITGGVAAVIDVGGFACLSLTAMPVISAATCSFLTATVVNYILTSTFVFRTRVTFKRYFRFLAGSLFSLLVNVILTSFGAIILSLPRIESKAVAVGITFVLSYRINSRLVFK
jgi:putative flippase GtrA